MSDAIPLTWNEALSGIFGSISLASWIFLLVPQLAENFKQKSADGISLTFLFIWFVGDAANLAGAAWARLVPTVVAIAVYFCCADFVLIAQCMYYNAINRKKKEHAMAVDEQAPLLGSPKQRRTSLQRRLTDVTEENIGLPGSRRRSSAASRRRTMSDNARPIELENILEEPTKTRTAVKNTLSILGIIAIGTAGWAIAWKTGAWRPTPVGEEDSDQKTPIGAEVLGYASAVLYLGARIPQIVKNQRERSCEGLSLLFFLLSLMGNATYGAGILFHSVEKRYFLTNLPWLIGSLGTMAEDVTIFVQFSMFGERKPDHAIDSTTDDV